MRAIQVLAGTLRTSDAVRGAYDKAGEEPEALRDAIRKIFSFTQNPGHCLVSAA